MEDNSKSWYCFPQTAPWSFETVCHWPQDRADRCQHSYNWLECVWQETTPWNCKGSERIVTEQRQNTHRQISANLRGVEGSFWFGEWGIVAYFDVFLHTETQNEWVSTIPKKYFSEAQSNYNKTIINSIWWPIYIINSVDKNKLSRYTTHWCSTTETYSLHYEVHLSVVMFELKWRHQTAKYGWWKIFSNP